MEPDRRPGREEFSLRIHSVIPRGAGPRKAYNRHMNALPAAPDELRRILELQRAAFQRELPVPAAIRQDRLRRAAALLRAHREALCEAISADFGNRPRLLSTISDVMVCIRALEDAAKAVPRWMRPERRAMPFPLPFLGSRARIEHQPKGVVGIVSPWNFPLNLVFMPLAGVLAAGNRAMLKPSEFVPETSALLQRLVAQAFDRAEIAVVTGDAAVAQRFTELPLDHLVFTGSTAVGRHVMRAAAANLVPVTLELGGKCPVIVSRSADLAATAQVIAQHKLFNAGQICLAPDYVLAPRGEADRLVECMATAAREMYPDVARSPDLTTIINARHYARLRGYVDDARSRGAQVLEVNPTGAPAGQLQQERRMPLTILRGVTDDMLAMQEEIFGPVLPVVEYGSIEQALEYVNARPRPLALYWFGKDSAEERRVLDATHSGGVSINEITWHCSIDDLPFGGIGPSGMGAYHGVHGFREFSHRRAIYRHGGVDLTKLMGLRPPYPDRIPAVVAREIGK